MSPTLWSSIDKTVALHSKGLTLRGGADLNIGATNTPKVPAICDESQHFLACALISSIMMGERQKTSRVFSLFQGDEALWLACDTTDGTVHTRPTKFSAGGKFARPSEITNT